MSPHPGGTRTTWQVDVVAPLVSLGGNPPLMALLVERAGLPVTLAASLAIVMCGIVNYALADRAVFAADGGRAIRLR